MNYMLDTNICIEVIRGKRLDFVAEFRKRRYSEFCISSISYAELLFGCQKSAHPKRNEQALEQFLTTIAILDFPTQAAHHYAIIRADLEKNGRPIGPNDLLIASHCLQESCVLITNNTREFERIASLKIENWIT